MTSLIIQRKTGKLRSVTSELYDMDIKKIMRIPQYIYYELLLSGNMTDNDAWLD